MYVDLRVSQLNTQLPTLPVPRATTTNTLIEKKDIAKVH